jgi:hypothetical protein
MVSCLERDLERRVENNSTYVLNDDPASGIRHQEHRPSVGTRSGDEI